MATSPQNILNMRLMTRDSNDSHYVEMVWNEDETVTNRVLNWLLNGADRTVDLSGNLTVEAASVINQDLSSDADVTFNSLTHSGLTGKGAVYLDAAKKIQELILTDGKVVIGSTGSIPVAATLTAGTGVTITNSAGSITVASSGGGLAWAESTSTPVTVGNNPLKGYVANHSSEIDFQLPATFPLGSIVEIIGQGAGKFKITAAAGDTIRMGDLTTKAAGYISAENRYNCITLKAAVADTTWQATTSPGSIFNVEVS